jgi:hypothetical protein
MEPSAVRTAIAQQHAARLQHEADAADADAHAAADRAELARTNQQMERMRTEIARLKQLKAERAQRSRPPVPESEQEPTTALELEAEPRPEPEVLRAVRRADDAGPGERATLERQSSAPRDPPWPAPPAPAASGGGLGGRVVCICGPPASGKGTQGARLAARFGLVHWSLGDALRAEARLARGR